MTMYRFKSIFRKGGLQHCIRKGAEVELATGILSGRRHLVDDDNEGEERQILVDGMLDSILLMR